MLEQESSKSVPTTWLEHPAIRAWNELQPQRIAPHKIETLHKGKKSAVYRLEEHRVLAAHWLGLLHLTAARLPVQARLPARGPGYYLAELRATREIILQNLASPALQAEDVAVLQAIVSQYDVLESRWSQVAAVCNRMPQTLEHGDFTERHVRFRRIEQGAVLLPFDWETAGWGTPAVDLAQCIVDSVSSPVTTYLSVVRPVWPHLDVQDLKQLASIGTIFWVILCISGGYYGIVYDYWTSRGLAYAYKCAQWSMSELRAYRTWMDDALRAVQWEDENR